LICGDFNDDPFSDTVRTLRLNYRSAFEDALGKEPQYTLLFKNEGEDIQKRTFDYVFY
jgi:endonuclease/exonuclease/phosphatase (EEP) superfamily protein YafD